MKRAITCAALALTVFVCGCKSDENVASKTNLTSANQPVAPREDVPPPDTKSNDVAGAPVAFEADDIVVTRQDREKAAQAERANAKTTPPQPARRLRPGDPGFTGGVAPGHIMWPPGNETGTGNPNSDGSHNIGAGANR